MTSSPYAEGSLAPRAKICDPAAAQHLAAADRHLTFATGKLGARLSPGAKILDFGCGIGDTVGVLLAKGYDAFGVDVLEYWGRDFDKYWHVAERPPAEIAGRLRLVDLNDYRLPFADATFDFCLSDQVFEHVFDYRTTMSEIVRVLKPGALSVHHFPGPNYYKEGHIGLPFPPLCYNRTYLTIWAWIAQMRGTASDWRQRVQGQLEIMRFNNYPTKAQLREMAGSANVEIGFVEVDEFMFRRGGRLKSRLLQALGAVGLARPAVQAFGLLMLQRYMILRGID
jgi:SAM-dependent methyltransferase